MRSRTTATAERLISYFQLSSAIPETKRTLFIRLHIVVIALLVLNSVLLPFIGFDWFILFANLLLTAILLLSTVLLVLRRGHQELVLFGVCFGATAWLLMVMFYNLVQVPLEIARDSLLQMVALRFIWIFLIYMACFFTFRAVTAFRMSLMICVLCMLVVLFAVVRILPVHLKLLSEFVALFSANLLVIGMAFPLAHSQERNSQTDFLTALTNRNGGYARLIQEIERAQRYEEAFAVILFDIDHFKKINDTCGHPCGDTVLREFAAFVNERVRRTDLLCRWGGEEFLLIMTRSDLASARLKANHLRQQISNRAFYNNTTLTASFGVTAYYPYDSANTILERVDTALYTAKRNGRNCVEAE